VSLNKLQHTLLGDSSLPLGSDTLQQTLKLLLLGVVLLVLGSRSFHLFQLGRRERSWLGWRSLSTELPSFSRENNIGQSFPLTLGEAVFLLHNGRGADALEAFGLILGEKRKEVHITLV
jgi:hypothetical protein